jgi:membrane protein
LAGGLSFSLFVCVVPMVLIIFSLLGIYLEKPSIASEIRIFIESLIPYDQFAEQVEEIVFNRVDEFRSYKGLAGLLGLVGMLFASSGLFSSMRTILNMIYKAEPHVFVLISKLRDFGMVFMVMLYFLFSTTILPGLNIIEDMADRIGFLQIPQLGFLLDLLLILFSLGVIFGAFFIIYFFVPQARLSKKTIAVSAISAAVLWEIAKEIFGFYITNMVTLKKIYGAYLFLIAVGFWIYYTSIVFILGALIGQLYREWVDKKQKEKLARL